MFAIVHMDDVVRIPPNRMKNSLNVTATEILKEKYESMISPELGYVIMIIDAKAEFGRKTCCWRWCHLS